MILYINCYIRKFVSRLKNRIIEKENYVFTNFDTIDTLLWDKIIDEKKILSENSLHSYDLLIHLLREHLVFIYFLN